MRKSLPKHPTEEMVDGLPRQIIMWLAFANPTGKSLHSHLRCSGTEIPEWLNELIPNIDHYPPKNAVSCAIYRSMWDKYTATVSDGERSEYLSSKSAPWNKAISETPGGQQLLDRRIAAAKELELATKELKDADAAILDAIITSYNLNRNR